MPEFIAGSHRTLMVVTPSAALMHSNLISSVLATGGKLVVDVDKNELTIWRPQKEVDIFYLNYSTGLIYLLPMNVDNAISIIKEFRDKAQKYGRLWLENGKSMSCQGDWFVLEKRIRQFYDEELKCT